MKYSEKYFEAHITEGIQSNLTSFTCPSKGIIAYAVVCSRGTSGTTYPYEVYIKHNGRTVYYTQDPVWHSGWFFVEKDDYVQTPYTIYEGGRFTFIPLE